IHAARQVDSDDRHASSIHCLDHGARQAFDLAIKAGAKQRINDDVAIRERGWRGRLDRPGPAASNERGVALQPSFITDEGDAHREVSVGQVTCRDKTVAAVITGPYHDHDASALV